jgi:hypothetical protein
MDPARATCRLMVAMPMYDDHDVFHRARDAGFRLWLAPLFAVLE